ncbi:hypothetical protein ACSBL2_06985 [Pedobacter sp. AW31-3R]|uniref:hypothetical protein n=1 Tax=Pedobacter sp. AW31-3R TaxID=3445781 RepID=UPI003FA12AD1
MHYYARLSLICFAITLSGLQARSQQHAAAPIQPLLFEGTIVAGYTDHGAYVNCTGPGIKFSRKPIALLVGLLPGLRIKEDKGTAGSTKNSVLTPSLGFGLTASYKHLAVQLPFYYNSKTAARNGKWNPGIGLGYKF